MGKFKSLFNQITTLDTHLDLPQKMQSAFNVDRLNQILKFSKLVRLFSFLQEALLVPMGHIRLLKIMWVSFISSHTGLNFNIHLCTQQEDAN